MKKDVKKDSSSRFRVEKKNPWTHPLHKYLELLFTQLVFSQLLCYCSPRSLSHFYLALHFRRTIICFFLICLVSFFPLIFTDLSSYSTHKLIQAWTPKFDPQHRRTKPDMVACTCRLSAGQQKQEDPYTSQASQSHILNNPRSYWETTSQKNTVDSSWGWAKSITPKVCLWTPNTNTYTSIYTLSYTHIKQHTHPHTHTTMFY